MLNLESSVNRIKSIHATPEVYGTTFDNIKFVIITDRWQAYSKNPAVNKSLANPPGAELGGDSDVSDSGTAHVKIHNRHGTEMAPLGNPL